MVVLTFDYTPTVRNTYVVTDWTAAFRVIQDFHSTRTICRVSYAMEVKEFSRPSVGELAREISGADLRHALNELNRTIGLGRATL